MILYAKIVDEETKRCNVGEGTNEEFYKSIGMEKMDVEKAYNGTWYVAGYAPAKPEPTAQEQIEALEEQITDRNIRSAIIGDEFAINKITQIEAQIEELRKQLEGSEQ